MGIDRLPGVPVMASPRPSTNDAPGRSGRTGAAASSGTAGTAGYRRLARIVPPHASCARQGAHLMPASAGNTVSALFASAVAVDPTRPLLTWYDDATGERTELSGATLDNWVAKTANL